MENNKIKLNEQQLKQIVAESVKNVLKEWENENPEGATYSYYNPEWGNNVTDPDYYNETPEDVKTWKKNAVNLLHQLHALTGKYQTSKKLKDILSVYYKYMNKLIESL